MGTLDFYKMRAYIYHFLAVFQAWKWPIFFPSATATHILRTPSVVKHHETGDALYIELHVYLTVRNV